MELKKADLHLHSKASNKPNFYALRKFNCPESFTTPQNIYKYAKKQGMDYVTITDHNSIDGVLEIAHLSDVFISCEFTAKFPEEDLKIHVVGLGLTEAIFKEANILRKNVYELIDFFRSQNIVHFIAHPFFDYKGRLTLSMFEKMVLLFNIFEVINGTKSKDQNRFNWKIVQSITQQKIEELANKHDIKPYGPTPWKKGMVGGSDDHAGLFIAKTFTSAPANSIESFLRSIEGAQSRACGEEGDHLTLPHAIYSIGYQFVQNKLENQGSHSISFFTKLLDSIFNASPIKLTPRERFKFWIKKVLPNSGPKNLTFNEILDQETKELLNDPEFQQTLRVASLNRKIFEVTSRLANRIMFLYAKKITQWSGPSHLLSIIEALGTLGFVQFLISPYYISYFHHHHNRKLLAEVKNAFIGPEPDDKKEKVALFTDTLNEINGVAVTIKRILKHAKFHGSNMTVIHSSSQSTSFENGIMNFQSIGKFNIPEYTELQLHFPPVLEVMEYIENEKFTRIHISTPGSMGILGLIIAKLLNLPVTGTYHTDIPQYVIDLTEDKSVGNLAMTYMIWFYSQMDEVTAPSASTMKQLEVGGLDPDKIKPLPRWVDSNKFHPNNADPSFWEKDLKNSGLKFLYVGRVSKEKNLTLLAESFKKLIDSGKTANLLIVGDGPYREKMETLLVNYPVVFKGYITGNDLYKAYSSADIFVFPSITDTWGNVVLEAQASGLPVIVSNMGGPQELMHNEHSGKIFNFNENSSLANALEFFIDNPEECKRMGNYAREFILSNKPSDQKHYQPILQFQTY